MSETTDADSDVRARYSRKARAMITLGLMVSVYVGICYLMMPEVWHRYLLHHPRLDEVPGITLTHAGIPGDPVNLALVGDREQLITAMLRAGWYPADPITLRSSLRIAADTVFRREYVDAPVSSLYLFGRKEDLAFEQPVGADPKQRHHIRFWLSDKVDSDGRPYWFGAATFDHGVGFSHTTGQITHHIAGDVDQERDHVMSSLSAAGCLSSEDVVVGFHKQLQGKNGGGDHWWTDGNLDVGVIKADLRPAQRASEQQGKTTQEPAPEQPQAEPVPGADLKK